MNIREISFDLHQNENCGNRSNEINKKKAFQDSTGRQKYDKRAGGTHHKMQQQNIWKHSSSPSA